MRRAREDTRTRRIGSWRSGAALIVALVAGATLSAVPVSAAPSPYADGTMFVADQDANAVLAVPSGGGSSSSFAGASESPQDVALDAAGDLFWTQAQDGTVQERAADGTLSTVATGLSSPWGIAVDSAGDLFVGAFGGPSHGPAGLYEIESGSSTPTLVTSAFGVFTSLAIDGDGDIWGADSAAHLVLIPHGSSTGEEVAIPGYGYINGVRLNSANDLFASTGFGDVAVELAAGSGTVQTFGTGLGYTEGVAVDGAGDVFVGQSATVPGFGEIFKIASGDVQTTYSSGGSLASTGGLALWPIQTPSSRTSTSVTLSTDSAADVTTQTSVSLTATLPGNPGGVVQFEDAGHPLGGLVAVVAGVAHLSTTLAAGDHLISATFLGSGATAPAVSNSLAFTATPIATTTTLTLPVGKVPGDAPVILRAKVKGSGGIPTGTVDFSANGTTVGSGALNANGKASASITPPPGSSNVIATYEGDSAFAGSSSKAGTLKTKDPYTAGVTLSVKYGAPSVSGAVRATLRVTVDGVGVAPAPMGTVMAGNGFVCGALAPIAGTHNSSTTCKRSIPSGFQKTVTVHYSGNANYDAASSSEYVDNLGGGGG
jgi:hypothetical protein